MGTFRMPSLGADMERGTITEWRVQSGDVVERGQIVAVVETEKSDIEIEIFENGVVGEVLVPVGVEVDVGTPIATVVSAGAAEAVAEAPAPPTVATTEAPHPPATEHAVVAHTRSPLVRHLAEELHLDVAAIEPSGPGGLVRRRDIEQAAEHRAPAPTAPTVPGPRVGRDVAASPLARRVAEELGVELATVPVHHPDGAVHATDVVRMAERATTAPEPPQAPTPAAGTGGAPPDRTARLQHAVGKLMERSKREIPHYYLSHDIDCDPSLVWLEDRNRDRPVTERVLPAALLLRAVVRAVSAVPECNGHYVDGAFVAADHVHLGIAVSTRRGGLLAPVVRDADQLGLDDLMAAMRDIVARARAGALRSSDTGEATITVTNLGDQGVDRVLGVIIPPQVAIVGFGRIAERPCAIGGMLAVRRMVTASLAADHRVTHGHRGARFLTAVAAGLADPKGLV